MLPAAKSNDRLMKANKGSVLIRDAALTLGIPQNRLVAWLIDKGWIYKNRRRQIRATASATKAGHVESVHREYQHEGNTRLSTQVYLTARGVAVLSRKRTDGEYSGGRILKAARSIAFEHRQNGEPYRAR